jgi:N-acetylglutamate synthase-like GNAT family acetyltransferase
MNDVVIRDIEKKDLPAVKSLMAEAFGDEWNLERFDQDSDFLQAFLESCLSVFLNSCTFGRAAVIGDEVVGVVMVAVNDETKKFRMMQKNMVSSVLAVLNGSEAERMDMAENTP